ncbi:MAG: hypothetical protein GX222_00145 [Ruminococcaceae bacterium]|mgnify:CR=1 FL=1|nr:hypothetical protein [Oscillospiraceae bacterium]
MKKSKITLLLDILFIGIIIANLIYAIIDGRSLAILLSTATVMLYGVNFAKNYFFKKD